MFLFGKKRIEFHSSISSLYKKYLHSNSCFKRVNLENLVALIVWNQYHSKIEEIVLL
jgi:hypothetical protein